MWYGRLSGWKWGVSAPWNSFPQQKDLKSWWWKQFDIMCFLMVRGDLCRNMFARTPDVWDDLGGHYNDQAQNVSAQASTVLRMLYCPVPGQALQSVLQILPGHHLCLDVCLGLLMRQGEESKTFRGRRWKTLISTHSLLCVLRHQVVWEAQRDRCSLLLCICTTLSSEND